MPPYVADTNILVRLITFDIPELAHKAKAQLDPLPDESVELPLYIMAEIVYVLASHSNYRYPRARICKELQIIISFPQFSISRDIAHAALELFKVTQLDFADCLLLAKHRLHAQTVLTFDKALLRKLT